MYTSGSSCRRGFSLIETAIAIVIIGTGIAAGMELMVACTRQNATSAQLTTATLLASNMHEALSKPTIAFVDGDSPAFGLETGESHDLLYTLNDIDDFDEFTANPPVDGEFVPLNDLAMYTQQVIVEPVKADDLTQLDTSSSPGQIKAKRVTVRVLYGKGDAARDVHRISWVRTTD